MHPTLIVIDDFYPDPLEIRRIALGYDYPLPEQARNYPGVNSTQKFLPRDFDQIVSQIVSEPVKGVHAAVSSHGRFRLATASDQGRYVAHVDPPPLYWVGVVYLSLPADCQGGTDFFRHKGSASEQIPKSQEELRAVGVKDMTEFMEQEGKDPDKWERTMTVPMRFNRLVLYRPWYWHSATAGFGDRKENCRLVQILGLLHPSQKDG